MRKLLFLLVITATGAVACSRKQTDQQTPAPSARVEAPVPSAAPSPAREAQPPPEDLDITVAKADLKCKGTKGPEACRILEEFSAAARWEADMPSGEGRWLGQAFIVAKGVERREILLMNARRVPTAQVGPSDLPLMIGTGGLPEDRSEHAEKLIRALKDGGTGKKTNLARMYLSEFKPKEQLGAIATKGASVQLIAGEDTYIRRASVKKLILVKLAGGTDAERGDGVYAEVWSVFW
ncbi:MAG: hypothetical protein JW751_09355 [Polyangiaceae bacterium]|nr:hypothetical protein [Polyangiaceae bacterium]